MTPEELKKIDTRDKDDKSYGVSENDDIYKKVFLIGFHPEITLDVSGNPTLMVSVINVPEVHVTNTPDVHVTNTPSVNVANVPNVQVTNTPNVSVTNTPNVNVANIGAVAVPTVNGVKSVPVTISDRKYNTATLVGTFEDAVLAAVGSYEIDCSTLKSLSLDLTSTGLTCIIKATNNPAGTVANAKDVTSKLTGSATITDGFFEFDVLATKLFVEYTITNADNSFTAYVKKLSA